MKYLNHHSSLYPFIFLVFNLVIVLSERPQATLVFNPRRVSEGQRVKGLCSVTNTQPPFSFRWEKNGASLHEDSSLKINQLDDMSVITIDSSTADHAGNYTCIVENGSGFDRVTSFLPILIPPRWIVKPSEMITVSQGANVKMDCLVESYPHARITWTKGGDQMRLLDHLPNGTLELRNVDKSVAGTYICTASNELGQEIAGSSTIKVLVPAKMSHGTEKFAVQTVRKEDSTSLRCHAIGDHPIVIHWSKDKQSLDPRSSSRFDHFETKQEDGLISELMIHSTERVDNGVYTCTVKNDHGQEEKSIKLLIVEIPESPTDLRSTEVWSRSVSLTWTAPFDGNSRLTKYLIHAWKAGTSHGSRLITEELKPFLTTHVVKNLLPGTRYAITIAAANEIGIGESSPAIHLVTSEEQPSAPPSDVALRSRGSSAILVTWRAPPVNSCNGNITGYYIQYRLAETAQPFIKTVAAEYHNNSSAIYAYLVTGLLKSKSYKVSVKAYNNAGSGPASTELLVSTYAGDVPNPPEIVSFNLLSKSSIKINWIYSPNFIATITSYTVYCRRDDLNIYTAIIPVPRHVSSYVIGNLEPGVKYSFYLTASNSIGESDLSSSLEVYLYESPIGFMLLLAESNLILVIAILISIATIALAILASCVYMKKAKAHHRKEVRRYQTLARAIPRHNYSEKCGTSHSSGTYATIPADRQLPSALGPNGNCSESNSQPSSSYYGIPGDADEIRPVDARHVTLMKKKEKDYEEIIYDDAH